ncbi:unnamed protein product [Diatraea saccharalis]|uniref:Nucleolus and neural progenitor protein-like N-terminal domain-containing protein n=1 Tax=Diatraea saccharalis TaxID=40085 RepID=A0A9N9WBQ0_9NEOP|nr:unnamed protein product [Diatraea saccharalis]
MSPLELWNDRCLEPPPNNTFLCNYSNDSRHMSLMCNNIKKVLSKQLPLHKEGALLSRFIYKFDKKFRNDIGYRNFKKVNTALHKYLSLNLLKDIENFDSLLPKNNEDNYLPTKQMLQYILIRIMTFAMIMKRICICSKQAAVYYMDRLKRGESYWMSLMPFALLSRIWSLSLILLQHCCSWYLNLYNYLDKLQLKGVEFLPAGYSLPKDLGLWLDIKNIDDAGRFQWFCKKKIQVNFNFSEDDNDDVNFDSILDFVKELNQDEQPQLENPNSSNDKLKQNDLSNLSIDISTKNIDKGQSISREYFQTFFNQSKERNSHSAEKVTNKPSLETFIANEEKYRNQESNESLTKHLSFMQWQSLKNSLIKLSESLSKNRKIEMKFKKIWKEKCLDCV